MATENYGSLVAYATKTFDETYHAKDIDTIIKEILTKVPSKTTEAERKTYVTKIDDAKKAVVNGLKDCENRFYTALADRGKLDKNQTKLQTFINEGLEALDGARLPTGLKDSTIAELTTKINTSIDKLTKEDGNYALVTGEPMFVIKKSDFDAGQQTTLSNLSGQPVLITNGPKPTQQPKMVQQLHKK